MLLNTKIPLTYILKIVKTEVCYTIFVSLLVFVITHEYREALPEMPLTIPTFLGTAISILLSFKLNQSYDRWWEARKVWGSIVNDSRTLILQALSFTKSDNETSIKKLGYRQIAWCYSLGQTLRGLNPLEGIENFLSAADLAALKTFGNKPLGMLQQHGLDIKALKEKEQLELFAQVQLDATLVRLCDAQGRAERIKSTVFPVTYRMFLHFSIYLFVVTLSIALKDVQWYFEIPLLLLISTAFFLLEKSATHMQDPFENRPTDTAITTIARNIEINIKQLLGEQNIPEPIQADTFYLP